MQVNLNLGSLQKWLQQKTTIMGFGVIAGCIAAYAGHQATLIQLIPELVGACVGLIMPEGNAAQEASTITAAAITAANNHTLATALPQLIAKGINDVAAGQGTATKSST